MTPDSIRHFRLNFSFWGISGRRSEPSHFWSHELICLVAGTADECLAQLAEHNSMVAFCKHSLMPATFVLTSAGVGVVIVLAQGLVCKPCM